MNLLLARAIDKVKEAVQDMKLPTEYDVRIYRSVYACCGVGDLGLIIEVAGPNEEEVRSIDQKALSRVLEFCEKEGYEVGHHFIGQYESVSE